MRSTKYLRRVSKWRKHGNVEEAIARDRREEGEAYSRILGEAGGELIVCDDCGAILHSTVLENEAHYKYCPRMQ